MHALCLPRKSTCKRRRWQQESHTLPSSSPKLAVQYCLKIRQQVLDSTTAFSLATIATAFGRYLRHGLVIQDHVLLLPKVCKCLNYMICMFLVLPRLADV